MLQIFDYLKIRQLKTSIINNFQRYGFIALKNVPEFQATYQQFITAARAFNALSLTEKAKCTPSKGANSQGWSFGIEQFNGIIDTHKGSYYADIPEGPHPNIWPLKVPNFKKSFTTLGNLLLKVGQELLPILSINHKTYGVGRMLYYETITAGHDNQQPNWCGEHCDHGLFTALCPEIFYQDEHEVLKPPDSGLYILDQEVSTPKDIILFQIGEVAELITNGLVQATKHYVKKAYGPERFTFALFFAPLTPFKIICKKPSVLEKYQDRYVEGMTTEEWYLRSYKKYEPTQ